MCFASVSSSVMSQMNNLSAAGFEGRSFFLWNSTNGEQHGRVSVPPLAGCSPLLLFPFSPFQQGTIVTKDIRINGVRDSLLIFLNSRVDLQFKVDDGISKGRKHRWSQ